MHLIGGGGDGNNHSHNGTDGDMMIPSNNGPRPPIENKANGETIQIPPSWSAFHKTNNHQTPSLSNLVAPGSASKITSVVTTIAKIHAQRLVQSARSIASAQGYSKDEKLQIHHLMEAHRVRSKYKSGFFMHSSSSTHQSNTNNNNYMNRDDHHSNCTSMSMDSNFAAAFGRLDKNRVQYEAALQAQEMYDKIMQDCNQNQNENDELEKSMESKDNKDEENDNEMDKNKSGEDSKKKEENKGDDDKSNDKSNEDQKQHMTQTDS